MRKIQLEFNYISPKKDIGLAKIKGEVDASNIHEFADFFKRLSEFSCAKLIFDLKELRYMNSTGFGNLAAFFLNEKDTGKREIYICSLHPNIQRTYRSFGMDQTWPTYPTVEEAVSAIQKARTSMSFPQTKRPTSVIFPIIRGCSSCHKPSNFPKPGTYRCPYCNMVHQIDEHGELKAVGLKKSPQERPSSTEKSPQKMDSEKTTALIPPETLPPTTLDVDVIDITIASNPNHLRRIRDFVFSFSDEIFTEQERYNMSTAVDEALANAIEHAHGNDPSKKIFIRIEVSSKKFQVTIKDSGVNTFNNIIQRDNISQDQIKKLGRGMGLLVIKQTMDEVSFNPTENWGTAITMAKFVKPKEDIQ